MSFLRLIVLVLMTACFALSCSRAGDSQEKSVTLYTSIDEPFARELALRFEKQTGIRVVLVTDAEATKTAGLAEKVLAEQAAPKADVYWGNEPFHTIRLAQAGAFTAYASPSAADVPGRFKDPGQLWTGIGYRARVVALSAHPQHAEAVANTTSLQDLVHPRFKGKLAIAAPATGTTAGHLAALYTLWGEEKFRQWVTGLRANEIRIVGGNSVVARLAGDGTIAAGLTDNDDIRAVSDAGGKLTQLIPDQPSGSSTAAGGTLLVPTTIALIKNGSHPKAAQQLIDFLATAETEQLLIQQNFLQGSLRDLNKHKITALDVDLAQVAQNLRTATELTLTILQDRAGKPK